MSLSVLETVTLDAEAELTALVGPGEEQTSPLRRVKPTQPTRQ